MRKKYILSSLSVFGLTLLLSGCALTTTKNTNSSVNSSVQQTNTASDSTTTASTNASEVVKNSDGSIDLGSGYSVELPDGWMIRDKNTDQTNTVAGGGAETYHTFVQTDKKYDSFAPTFSFHAFTIDPVLTAEQVFSKRDLYSECVVSDSKKNSIVNGIFAFSAVLSIDSCQPAAETEDFYRQVYVLKETGESPTLLFEATTSSETEHETIKADFEKMMTTLHFE